MGVGSSAEIVMFAEVAMTASRVPKALVGSGDRGEKTSQETGGPAHARERYSNRQRVRSGSPGRGSQQRVKG